MLDPRGAAPDPDQEAEEPPLDPAVARVQARLRRLMLVSGLTTLLGFSAVAVAVFYRLSALEDTPPAAASEPAPPVAAPLPADLRLALPEDARVLSVGATDREFVLLVETAAGRELLAVDRASGEVAQRVRIATGARSR